MNHDTGESKFTLDPPPGVKNFTGPGSAARSYTILEFDDTPPNQRELDMGAVLAMASDDITYRTDPKNKRRGTGRKPGRGRRKGRRGRFSRRK
jgi:hypothetical protein